MSAERSSEQTPKPDTLKNNVPPIQDGRIFENPLSEREMEVARLLSTGASNGEIAQALIISPHTVKVHLRNIFEKLEVNSRTEASMLLVQRGWLTVPGVEVAQVAEIPVAAAPVAVAPVAVTSVAGVASSEPENKSTLVPVVPPDPAPLSTEIAQLAGWQRVFFVVALLMAIVAFVLPSLRSRATASPNLLSDATQIGSSPAEVLSLPRWQQLTPLSEPRSRMAIAYLENRLVSLGGETTGGQLTDAVEIYDVTLNDWSKSVALPVPLSNSAAAVISDTIYVAGGTERTGEGGETKVANVVLQWSMGQPNWSKLTEMINPLAGAALVADADSLYLIGGWDGQQMHDEVWRLVLPAVDGSLPAWQLLTRLPSAKAFVGAALVDQQLYVVGGSDGQKSDGMTARFDLKTNEWKELKPLPNPWLGFALVYDGSALFVLGGDEEKAAFIHQRYDISADEWTNFPSPVQGAWRHLGAASANGRIFMVGGWSGDYLDGVIEYQSSYRLLLPVISKDQ